MGAADALGQAWDDVLAVIAAAGLAAAASRPAAVTNPIAVLYPGATPWAFTALDGRTIRAGINVVCFGSEVQPLAKLAGFSADVGLALASAGIRPGPPETIITNQDAGVLAISIPVTLTRSIAS
jgi:ABC-type amino acid transport substrate-binding protein